MTNENYYKSAKLNTIKLNDVSIGLREFGAGEALILIHGFPTHGYTWRKILPQLVQKYKCYVVDLPGLGDSEWSKNTNFKSEAQASYVLELIEKKNIQKCSIIAHDSGATVARVIALEHPNLVNNLILINTEMPHHRPPWIPFYQTVGLWPFVPNVIRFSLNQSWFIQSPMGLKEAYSDKSMLLQPENLNPYIEPLIRSQKKAIGAFKYLKGIDWKVIDKFEETHRQIKAKTLLVWGEDDKTFPIKYAKKMVEQFDGNGELIKIKNASLLPHEEKSEVVGEAIMSFLKKSKSKNKLIY